MFRELVGRHHYLGHAIPFGAIYATWSTHRRRPGGGAARDGWIGWDEATRRRNLQRVVNNRRFLILPWVRVRNLASSVLSLVARQLPGDWHSRYGALAAGDLGGS